MSRSFRYGTLIEVIEQLMMMAPNFIPGGRGTMI